MKEFMMAIDDIRFDNIDELFVKKAYIKEKYNKLSFDMKELYKWYFFYQLCLLKNPLKSAMWDYINGFDVGSKLNDEYILFCEKRDKLRAKYLKENIENEEKIDDQIAGQMDIWQCL